MHNVKPGAYLRFEMDAWGVARNFQNWLKAYLDFTRDSESPRDFHFWVGVSTIAGALRRRVWIDMKKFQWTPNFYIILVGPAGVAAKSTSISMGMSLLKKVPGIKFGPESMTWQALAKDFSDAIEYLEYHPIPGKPDKLRIAMSSLTIPISELGMFLRTDDKQLEAFLIRMWEGQEETFDHKTKSSGNIDIKNPWLNIIAATTPTWLRENFPEGMIGGGLTSRIVFVYGDKKRALIPYPDEVIPAAEYGLLRDKLVEDLIEISKLSGPITLSQFAREWGRHWYSDHNDPNLRPQHLSSDRYDGYLARKQTHLHKFATILSAAKRNTGVIEEEDLREAEAIITSTERDMIRVFDSIGPGNQQKKNIETLVSVIRYYGPLSSKGLWTKVMNQMSLKDFEESCRAAIHARMLELCQVGGLSGVKLYGS